MSKDKKRNGAEAALPPPAASPVRERIDVDYADNPWDETPALSWVMNFQEGQLHARGTHPGADLTKAPVAVLGRLLRALVRDSGTAPLQFLSVLPALDGTLHPFLIIGAPLGVLNGPPEMHFAGVAIDVTRHQQQVDQLTHQALGDDLTGAYNLRGFKLFAEHELKAAQRRQTRSAVLYVDVDGLKGVNDSNGHGEGDRLLIETARVLRRVFRECDVIGRLGGDEFAVFAADVRGDPGHLCERLRAELRAASASAGQSTLALSIGVASCAHDSGMPLSVLLAAADHDMYGDKARRRGHHTVPAASGPAPTLT